MVKKQTLWQKFIGEPYIQKKMQNYYTNSSTCISINMQVIYQAFKSLQVAVLFHKRSQKQTTNQCRSDLLVLNMLAGRSSLTQRFPSGKNLRKQPDTERILRADMWRWPEPKTTQIMSPKNKNKKNPTLIKDS